MSKAEKFISEHTRKLTQYGDDYFLWVTTDDARRAVEIAREEVINGIKERVTTFLEGAHEYTDNKKLQMQYDNEGLIRDFREFIENIKQEIKDE